MHVKLNLFLLLLLFPNFTEHSYDISQKLPRVQCTVNSNGWDTVIATFTYWCIWHRSPASNISKIIVFHKKIFFKKHTGEWDSVTTLKYRERYSWYSCQISRNQATTKLSCMAYNLRNSNTDISKWRWNSTSLSQMNWRNVLGSHFKYGWYH